MNPTQVSIWNGSFERETASKSITHKMDDPYYILEKTRNIQRIVTHTVKEVYFVHPTTHNTPCYKIFELNSL